MRMQAENKNLTFILDTEQASEFDLMGDSFRLRQILYNLLGNAVKFTSKGFIKLAVKTHDEEEHVRCTFEITDTGIGIFPEELEKIFNQFEQANPHIAKHFGGTGLGLTIVKSLIDAQQGTLEVSSKPGFGSSFQVNLKFEKCRGTSHVGESKLPGIDRSFNGKVLFVDDDPLILRLCSLILSKNNIQHITFQNPELCLSEPVDDSVTHVFLDIRMPTMNGVELCHALKQKYPEKTRFIALTAHVLKDERDSILQEGFDALLPKPFRESDLIDLLSNFSHKVKLPSVTPDLSALRQMTLNDESLFQSVLSQFVDETSDDIRTLKGVLADGDAKTAREVVHRLSGRLSQIGIANLGSRFGAIEKQIVDGKNIDDISAELHEAAKRVEELIAHLRLTTLEHLN